MATAVLCLLGAGPAAAASPAVHLGQAATVGQELGPCECTAVQFEDLGLTNASYAIPFDGVITKTGFLVGQEVLSTDFAQARVVTKTGAGSGVVSAEGEKHFLSGLTSHTVGSFYDRIPASAGQVLGARFHTGSFIERTTAMFHTTSSADVASEALPDPALGSPFSTSPGTKLRVNLEAVLEPDADSDGYGDVSQDLCPGSPIGGGACSGSLFGSNFEGNHGGAGSSGFNSMIVQKAIHGASTALPANGVVVRWRVLGAPTGSYQMRVLAPSGSEYKVLRSSAVESVTAEGGAPIASISSFATRLPVPAGSYLALATPTAQPESIPSSGSALSKVNNAGDGATVPSLPTNVSNFELAYDADVEPDADGDGYGDITQDACPTDASTQGPCPPTSSTTTRPPPTGVPVVTVFTVAPSAFSVNPAGPALAAAKAPARGAKLKLTLSEPATVAFTIEMKVACKTGRKASRCRPWKAVHSFPLTRSLPSGRSSIPFSGRYPTGQGKAMIRTLAPGSYRIAAVPTNAARVAGKPVRATFTVVR